MIERGNYGESSVVESGRLATIPPLKIIDSENLKIKGFSDIIFIESERYLTSK